MLLGFSECESLLVLLYQFRTIVPSADWAFSSRSCAGVHSKDAILK